MKWTIAWIYNGKECHEEYDSFPDAFARVMQLTAYGMEVSIHSN